MTYQINMTYSWFATWSTKKIEQVLYLPISYIFTCIYKYIKLYIYQYLKNKTENNRNIAYHIYNIHIHTCGIPRSIWLYIIIATYIFS